MLRIGRVGRDVNLRVSRWDDRDRTTQVEFSVRGIGHSAATTLRDQLLGYVNSPDEAFVPVLWDDDPSVAGYYRVLSVSVTPHRAGAFLGYYAFAVTIERVTGYAAPLIELHSLGTVRTNEHSSATATQSYCFPAAAQSIAFLSEASGSFIPFAAARTREGARGDVLSYDQLASQRYTAQFYVDPAGYYDGAATVLAGDDLAVVVGRQVPNTPDSWRVTNGLFEVEPDGSGGFGLRCRMFLDGAFTDWVPFSIISSGVLLDPRVPLPAPHTITILRNGPEEVAIRLLTAAPSAFTGNAYSPIYVDISLRRGARWVGVELRSVFNGYHGVRCPALASGTYTDSEYWNKAVGAARMVVGGPETIGQTGDDLYPYQSAIQNVKVWTFMIGLVDGSDSDDTVADAFAEYMFAGSQKQAVVAQ